MTAKGSCHAALSTLTFPSSGQRERLLLWLLPLLSASVPEDVDRTITVEAIQSRSWTPPSSSTPQSTRMIIFTLYKREALQLSQYLARHDISNLCLTGDQSLAQRRTALEKFASQTQGASILVATDVAARGLDINNVNFVINCLCISESNDNNLIHLTFPFSQFLWVSASITTCIASVVVADNSEVSLSLSSSPSSTLIKLMLCVKFWIGVITRYQKSCEKCELDACRNQSQPLVQPRSIRMPNSALSNPIPTTLMMARSQSTRTGASGHWSSGKRCQLHSASTPTKRAVAVVAVADVDRVHFEFKQHTMHSKCHFQQREGWDYGKGPHRCCRESGNVCDRG